MKIIGLYGSFGWNANQIFEFKSGEVSDRIHNSGVTLFIDGNHICSISEERLSRIKRDGNFPEKSIDYCLSEGKINNKDIDLVCVPLLSCYKFYLMDRKDVIAFIKKYFPNAEVKFISHHFAHAMSSILTSDMTNGNVMTLDGGGTHFFNMERELSGAESNTYGVFDKEKKNYKLMNYHKEVGSNGFGSFYSNWSSVIYFFKTKNILEQNLNITTHHLETTPGKIMGLSAYGKTKKDFRKINENNFYEFVNIEGLMPYVSFAPDIFYEAAYFKDRERFQLSGKKIRSDDTRYTVEEMAYWLQTVYEDSLTDYLTLLKKYDYINDNCCFSGGCFLNVLANTKLKKIIKNIHIPPFPDDSGLHFGAAAWASDKFDNVANIPKNTALLGKEYTNEEIEEALKRFSVSYKKYDLDELIEITSIKIDQNKIIGWFQGRSEYGPRALGSRSILMSPKNKNNKDILNSRVKHREYWRPFAGVILEERMEEYFTESFSSPYMLYSFTVKDEKINEIPAITHVDKSCRVQTVTDEYNYKLTLLLDKCDQLTGTPVLLNTSFNINGQPIVESPYDAVKAFLDMDIDILVIGNFIVEK